MSKQAETRFWQPVVKRGLLILFTFTLVVAGSSTSFEAPAVPLEGSTKVPAVPASLVQQGEYSGDPISLKVVGVSVVDFFRTISEYSGLNILIDPDVSGTLTLNVEKVPWDQLFEAVLASQGLSKRVEGNLIRISTGDRIRQEQEAQKAIKDAELAAQDTVTVSRRLNYASGATILNTLTPHLTQGRGLINVDERTNTLIITDIPEAVGRISKLLKILDVPEKQVEIEARIIEASTNFARSLGSQLGVGVGRFDSSSSDVGNERVGGFGSVNTGEAAGKTATVGIRTGNLLDTIKLDAMITAAESQGEARILSKPRVTAQNNAEAVITQGSQIPVPVQQNFTTTVQFQTAALQLTVTPRVTNVDTVLLNILVENNIPDFSRTVLGIPAINTSQSSTQVLVPDGGTTVIGGIYVETKSENENRVPGLGRIPVIGNLFKNTTKKRDTREILFFITARITPS